MANLEDAMARIRTLECPTGDLEHRVTGILENYEIANGNEIIIDREEGLDRTGIEAYRTNIQGSNGESIVILAKSGEDDYVAKVVDVYIT